MKFFYYLFISYFLLQIANLYRIINDPQLKIYAKRQYSKKVKKVLRRKPIYDKHGLLLSYSLVKEEREKREYMVKELLSILGIVGFEEHGMSGIELAYDRYLSTKEQICFLSRLTAKDKIHGYIANPTTAGLKTTLDAQLSLYINTFLKEVVQKYRSKFGVCIVMDGTTGAIEVMTQFPFYSPEKEECDVPLEYLYPLGVTQAYEMGSIIKSFLALAAIHTNVVHADDIINCYGVKEKKFKGRTITTWKAHDKITFKEVIQGSNNIGVAQVGQLIGTKLFDVYQMCGFGKSTGIELIGEHKGILYDPSKWSKQSLISLTFGYEMAITLLQGVVAWSLFTNEGRLLVPRLLLSEDRKMSDILFTSKVIEEVRNILSLDEKKMRSFGLKKKLKGRLYGKTGTANILVNKQYDKEQNTYSFLGHYESEEEKKIIGIFIYGSDDHTLYASDVALPLFLKICAVIDGKR